jgi:hypothetical protein
MFHRILYQSTASHAFSSAELFNLLMASQVRNARLGITGHLLYRCLLDTSVGMQDSQGGRRKFFKASWKIQFLAIFFVKPSEMIAPQQLEKQPIGAFVSPFRGFKVSD